MPGLQTFGPWAASYMSFVRSRRVAVLCIVLYRFVSVCMLYVTVCMLYVSLHRVSSCFISLSTFKCLEEKDDADEYSMTVTV